MGSGGHARVVADGALALGMSIAGLVAPGLAGGVFGLELLGGDDDLADLCSRGIRRAALGIGDNARRRTVAKRAIEAGLVLAGICHPGAMIGRGVVLGAGTVILAGAVVNALAEIGAGVVVNSCAVVEHDAMVGDYAHIAPGARILGGARVGESAFIGSGAIVLPGRNIGAGTIVGAGSVVTRDICSGGRVYGVPARDF